MHTHAQYVNLTVLIVGMMLCLMCALGHRNAQVPVIQLLHVYSYYTHCSAITSNWKTEITTNQVSSERLL